jgi:hypothetical protein
MMQNWTSILPKGQFSLLIGQFIILFLCIAYTDHFYWANIAPDKEAKAYFQQTSCFLINKKLSTKGRILDRYRADFLVSYQVNGVQYNKWMSGNGLDHSFSTDRIAQETTLSQYQVGSTYPCWYDATDPQIALLVMRHNWTSTFPLILPAIVGIVTLYYFLTNLFSLVNIVSQKRQEK